MGTAGKATAVPNLTQISVGSEGEIFLLGRSNEDSRREAIIFVSTGCYMRNNL